MPSTKKQYHQFDLTKDVSRIPYLIPVMLSFQGCKSCSQRYAIFQLIKGAHHIRGREDEVCLLNCGKGQLEIKDIKNSGKSPSIQQQNSKLLITIGQRRQGMGSYRVSELKGIKLHCAEKRGSLLKQHIWGAFLASKDIGIREENKR